MVPGLGIDRLGGDSHPIGGAADAAFDHIAHTELARDLADFDGGTLVGEGGAARDHKERAVAREIGDDVLGNSLGEIFLFDISAHIGERKHRDRRLLGRGPR